MKFSAQPPIFRFRLKNIWKTLRFRLAIWNALVVLITALVILLGVRQGVRWALLHEMDQILTEDIQEISLALQDARPNDFPGLIEELQRKAVGHRSHGWFVELLNAKSQLVWSSVASTTSSPSDIHDPTHQGSDEYRLIEEEAPANPHAVAVIRVGGTTRFVDDDMTRIDRLVAFAVAVVLVVAPISGYWLASRAARTLGDIIHTASRLRPNHLSERLPIRGTGDELDQLAFTVNGLLDRIAAYLEQKRDFLADAAHELRTPLAAIRSSVEVALNSDRTREEYEDLLVDLIAESSSLETLVNQLLLISESEAELTRHETESIPMHEVVSKAVDMFRGVAETRDIRLSLELAQCPIVQGCRHHLRQVVNNLIDNAIKYTLPGGQVNVLLTRTDHGMAKIVVQDSGIGIAADDLPKVFDRFFRADKSRTRLSETVGSGLGLCICHSVVTAHQGHISCASTLGKGTTFTVLLPSVSADSNVA